MSGKENTPFTSLLTVPEWTGVQLTGIINRTYEDMLNRGVPQKAAQFVSLEVAGNEALDHVSGERNTNREWVKGGGYSTPQQPSIGELKAPQVYGNKDGPGGGRGSGEMMA